MKPSIVVLVNQSETAEHAAHYAAALGAPLHAHVALLHLHHDPMLLAPDSALVTAAQTDRSYAEVAADMAALAQELPGAAEATVSVLPMAEAVAEAVLRHQPLLLAMGLSPEHDVLDHLLRNHVLPVLRATHLPLLLVPQAAARPAAPRRVLLALDAELYTLSTASRELAPLLAAWQAAYTVTHVMLDEKSAYQRRRMAMADVRASGLLPPDAPLWVYQERDVAPAAGILQALADTQADLLVLIARPRSFLKGLFHRSVTTQLLERCPVPVLVLPVAAAAEPVALSRPITDAASWTAGALAGLSPAN
ncbi:universal stress protein [Hymenobacter arizonensis]|uniref:Nucleotide-binding universal stress protein, UspA family n=1 Tax=Hymenobacter arizonensis TaxID=1227077 RepID=A0A1I5U347_HYMAR|nr:universal stress protein [Hymenobacter arizonensis]SFP89611.1 Nucleotide-binding universal stress protein, UspA family [Hymenobacter arizonensis]